MEINIEVNRLSKALFDRRLVEKAANIVIEGETSASDGRSVELSIVFVGPKKIKEINRKYRNIDQVTDVLSFSETDEFNKAIPYRILGELAVCCDQVKKNARQAGVRAADELAWVIVHGILHLFGYDHETSLNDALKMRQKEEYYLSKIK